MKRQFITIVLFSFLFVTACNDCHLVDCAPETSFLLEINDSETGNSLITNTDSTYHADSIIVNNFVDGELILGSTHARWDGTDSVSLYTMLNPEPDMIILELSSNEIDTLFFAYRFIEGECCDNYPLDSVAINNGPMTAIQNGIVTILK